MFGHCHARTYRDDRGVSAAVATPAGTSAPPSIRLRSFPSPPPTPRRRARTPPHRAGYDGGCSPSGAGWGTTIADPNLEDGDLLIAAHTTPGPNRTRAYGVAPAHSRTLTTSTPSAAPGCAPPLLRPLCAVLVVLVGAVASVGVATVAAPAAGAPTGPPSIRATSPTRASSSGMASTTASPPRTSRRRARRSTSRCPTSADGVHWNQPSGVDALPTLGAWAKPGDTWAPSVAHDSRGQRLRHVLHGDGDLDRRPVHRRGHVARCPPAPTRTPTRIRSCASNGVDRSRHPRQRQLGRQHRPRHLHRQRRDLLAAVEERRQPHRQSPPPSGRCSCRRVSTRRSVSRPSCCGTTSRGRATSSRAPTWSRPTSATATTTSSTPASDEGASTYAIGWASCPSGPAAACTEMSSLAPARHPPGMSGPGGRTSTRSRRRPAGHGLRGMAGDDDRLSRAAASGPCTWPSSTSPAPAGRPRWRPYSRHRPGGQPELPAAAAPGTWILAGGLGRRHLQLRRRAVLRLDGLHAAQQARRRHGGHPGRQRLLAGGQRRRRVRLRRRRLLRLDGQHHAEQTDHRLDPHHRRRGLLADRQRRRRVRLRRRQVLRLRRR